jgi:hypothetical protein
MLQVPPQNSPKNSFSFSATFPGSAAVIRLTTENNKTMDNNLREVLMPLAIFGAFGGALVFFTRTLTDYILRKRMIDKGYVNEEAQSIFKQHAADNKYSSLKWGLIVFFGGLSLILMEYIDFDTRSPFPYGLFAVAVSLGFLLYYFLVKKDSK